MKGVEPSRPASNSTQHQQQRVRYSSDLAGGDKDLQERGEGPVVRSTPSRLNLEDGNSSQMRGTDEEKGPLQPTEVVATAEGTSGTGVNISERMENGLAAAAAPAANPDASDSRDSADGEDWFDVKKDTAVPDFKYDYKEAICLDLSRAGGVAAVATPRSTPGADAAGFPKKGGAHHGVNQTQNGIDANTSAGDKKTLERATANPNQNPMDMSIRGKYEMRRFTAAVAATATATATATSTDVKPTPSVAGLSRRKAPMTPAVRYLLEAMCTDLQCCGECFVPHFRASQTLVRFCGFVPFEVDEGLDEETRRFMEGENARDAAFSGNAAAGGEAYGRGIGLPGIAWASSRATLVEISTLTSDESFDCGGVRLAQAGQLFHTALTVPLYFTSPATSTNRTNVNMNGLWERKQLMGVVVVYFRAPREATSASALVSYAAAVAKSAAPMSELMVQRARFVVGRSHRIKRKWRVLVIALRFAMPILVKYHKLTGKSVTEGATTTANGFGFRAATAAVMAEMSASRHRLRVQTTNHAMMVVNQPGGGTSRGWGTKAWLSQYLAKAKGGAVNLPPPANPRDAFVTWFGTFAAIGSLELIYDGINRSPRLWGTQEDVFVLSGSFGALATIVFAIPGAPLGQPRIVLSAHAFAIAVSLVAISVFEAGRAVWLQHSVTVASVILGMSLTRIVHPPAGALCLVLLGAHNKGATWEGMLMLVASVVMGLAMHIAVGVCINNISPRRGYPVFW